MLEHGRDGFRGTQPGAESALLSAQVSVAADRSVRCHAQCRGGAVDHMPRASAPHLVPSNTVVRASTQLSGEVCLGVPAAHIPSHLTQDRLGDHHVDAVDPCQIHSGDALQFATHVGSLQLWINGLLPEDSRKVPFEPPKPVDQCQVCSRRVNGAGSGG